MALYAITSVLPDIRFANNWKECLNQQFFWLFTKILDLLTLILLHTAPPTNTASLSWNNSKRLRSQQPWFQIEYDAFAPNMFNPQRISGSLVPITKVLTVDARKDLKLKTWKKTLFIIITTGKFNQEPDSFKKFEFPTKKRMHFSPFEQRMC